MHLQIILHLQLFLKIFFLLLLSLYISMLFLLKNILHYVIVNLSLLLFHNKFLHFESHLTLCMQFLGYSINHNLLGQISMHLDIHLLLLYTFHFLLIFRQVKYLHLSCLVFYLISYTTFLMLLLFCLIHLIVLQLYNMNHSLFYLNLLLVHIHLLLFSFRLHFHILVLALNVLYNCLDSCPIFLVMLVLLFYCLLNSLLF